jgi:hypothetical protein
MAKRYKTLEQWVRETLSESRQNDAAGGKDSGCTALALAYMQPTGGLKDLDIVRLSGKTWNSKDLADRFQGKAETFAQDMGGVQMFQVLAFFGSREPQAFHNFKVVDGEIAHGGEDRRVKETPDSQGLVGFTMRHLERTQDLLTTLVQGIVAKSVEREKVLYDQIDKQREELNDSTLIIREMIMEKRKDAFDMDMRRLEFQRDSKNQGLMLEQAPALINTISGKEVFPQTTADKQLVDRLCEKVAPENVDQLVGLGVIPAEMAGPLKLRIAQYREEQAKKVAELKNLPVAAGVPGETSSNLVPFDRKKTGDK